MLNDFPPISLCNTSFKVLTKVLVNRLRPLLGELISPFQALDKRASDNVQEMIHSLEAKTISEGVTNTKIDLYKAYDRIEWNFLDG